MGKWWFKGLMVVQWDFMGFTLWCHQSHGWLEAMDQVEIGDAPDRDRSSIQ